MSVRNLHSSFPGSIFVMVCFMMLYYTILHFHKRNIPFCMSAKYWSCFISGEHVGEDNDEDYSDGGGDKEDIR